MSRTDVRPYRALTTLARDRALAGFLCLMLLASAAIAVTWEHNVVAIATSMTPGLILPAAALSLLLSLSLAAGVSSPLSGSGPRSFREMTERAPVTGLSRAGAGKQGSITGPVILEPTFVVIIDVTPKNTDQRTNLDRGLGLTTGQAELSSDVSEKVRAQQGKYVS